MAMRRDLYRSAATRTFAENTEVPSQHGTCRQLSALHSHFEKACWRTQLAVVEMCHFLQHEP